MEVRSCPSWFATSVFKWHITACSPGIWQSKIISHVDTLLDNNSTIIIIIIIAKKWLIAHPKSVRESHNASAVYISHLLNSSSKGVQRYSQSCGSMAIESPFVTTLVTLYELVVFLRVRASLIPFLYLLFIVLSGWGFSLVISRVISREISLRSFIYYWSITVWFALVIPLEITLHGRIGHCARR